MKMIKSILVLVACLALALGACSPKEKEKQPEQTTESEEQKDGTQQSEQTEKEVADQAKLAMITPSAYQSAQGIKLKKGSYISVIGKADSGAFWNEIERGAQAATEDLNEALGYEGKDEIRMTYNGPAEADNVDEQVNILDEELARYPSAVAIAITDTKACEVQFDLATENKIPIVAFDSGNEYKGIQAMTATDNKSVAEEAAKRMGELVGKDGKIVVLVGDSQSESSIIRETVFTDTIKNGESGARVCGVYHMDQMKKIIADEINVGKYTLDGSEPTGEALEDEDKIQEDAIAQEDIFQYIFEKNPDMKGIYATNEDTVTAAVSALEDEKKGDVALIGYDINETELEALENGTIDALAVQNPYGMGYASVISAARAAMEMGNEAYINTGYVWVTADNLDQEEIQNMLY